MQGDPNKASADFSAEILQPEESGIIYMKVSKKTKTVNQEYIARPSCPSEMKER